MTTSSPWEWFHDLIQELVAPTVAQFGFTDPLPNGYPGDDNWEWEGGASFGYPGIHLEIDLQDWTHVGYEYFLIRCHVFGTKVKIMHLKQFLYPGITQQTRDTDLWQGWKCHNRDEIRDALIEIATGLNTLFTKYPPSA